jgi:hypothetical protein
MTTGTNPFKPHGQPAQWTARRAGDHADSWLLTSWCHSGGLQGLEGAQPGELHDAIRPPHGMQLRSLGINFRCRTDRKRALPPAD